MTRGPASRLLAAALLVGLLAACQPETVVVQRPPIPDQPTDADRLGDATVVSQGNGPLGEYRAWVYGNTQGERCFQVATQAMASIGCGPAGDEVLGIGSYEVDGGWFVAGGTRQPAVSAVVHTIDGGEIRGPVDPAPPGVAAGTSWLVIPVPEQPPTSIDLLDAGGAVLETIDLTP
jgi:hypothetical protein